MPSTFTQDRSRSLDLFAGSFAGATATVITYPLEVFQTRLQSSTFSLRKESARLPIFAFERNICLNVCCTVAPVRSIAFVSYAKSMLENEGFSLFSRGLGANVAAISMSKGIYFTVYSSCKKFLRDLKSDGRTENTYIHISSAAFAGFASCTLTNPIWFLKTRLQLDNSRKSMRNKLFIMPVEIYKKEGIRAFYSGLTASYLGIAETVIHFAIYEYLRSMIRERRRSEPASSCRKFYVSDCVVAASVSKTIATIVAYPHEVFRTRMRELENMQKSFSGIIRTIFNNEGWQGFYGGLGTHLIRQVPNTAILFLTYEAVVYLGTQFGKDRN